MKNKRINALTAAFVIAIFLVGCGKLHNDQENKESSAAETAAEETAAAFPADSNTTEPDTIQNEIASLQARSDALENADMSTATQLEMTHHAEEIFNLWDEELNSLWSRLSEKLDADAKAELLDEQLQWIRRKEAAMEASGKEASGGSMQPMLEYRTGANLTEVRVYKLAGILADLRGESFEITDEMQQTLDTLDPTVEAVFEYFEGEHLIYDDPDHVIKFEKAADSDILPDQLPAGATWVVTVFGSDVLTDKDVYSFTPDSITFVTADGAYEQFYENLAGGITLAYGTDPDSLEDQCSTDD